MPFYQHFSDKEDLVRSSLDVRAQALLSDQRQQLAEVTNMAGLDTWRDNLVAANRQRSMRTYELLAQSGKRLPRNIESTNEPGSTLRSAFPCKAVLRHCAVPLLSLPQGGRPGPETGQLL